ncbi:MAG TPA: hypothetical protein VHJ78_11320, partial [Actinomycetota bacterium]|nr:hypothetical protein [Actinomycetota bacterium]
LAAPSDVAMAVELFEVAVTWQELDYSGEAVISPVDWLEFAAQHSWDDPRLARRLFRAARDIALRHPADTRPSVVTTPFLTSKEETQ